MDRERDREMQREDVDPLRPPRAQVAGPHHHHHLHHHHHHRSAPSSVSGSSQGHGLSSKSTKALRPTEAIDMSYGGPLPPGMGLGSMPPPFAPLTSERPPPGFAPHKQISSKMANGLVGPGPMPSALGQMPPQHLHPSHHIHLHPHAHALRNPPLGFPTSRSPPPHFGSALSAQQNSSFFQPHSPRPPLLPALPPLNLGTFVYPHTPFPFLDFPSSPSEAAPGPGVPVNISDREVREIRTTILVPSGFLPTQRPTRPRIWGGAPIPSFSPLFATPQLVHHMQSGMSYGFRRPHPFEVQGTRRVYTDDSDLVLCALHAGWVSWSGVRAARREGRDLKLEVRLTREARFVGGFGARCVGGEAPDEESAPLPPNIQSEDDGSSLLSYGWGNSHDGSGLEILRAGFVDVSLLLYLNRSSILTWYIRRRTPLIARHCGIVLSVCWSMPRGVLSSAVVHSPVSRLLASDGDTSVLQRTRTDILRSHSKSMKPMRSYARLAQ